MVKIEPEKIQNIIILRKHNQIGDLLVSRPLIYALRKHFPDARIVLLASKTNYPIPFKDLIEEIDEVIIYDKSSVLKQLKLIKLLRSKKFDLGIVPATIRFSTSLNLINFLIGCKYRVGVKSLSGKKNKLSLLFNIKSDFDWINKRTHQVIRNLEISKLIGCRLTYDEILSFKFNFLPHELEEGKKYFMDRFNNDNLIIGLHPGAGKIENVWSAENFISLIQRISEKFDINFFITSGSTDEKIIQPIINYLKTNKINYTIAHNLPIRKLAIMINICDIFVSNDTGTMHIAGLTDTKLISLFGKTKAWEWSPLSKNKFYIQSKSGSIDGITVEEVEKLVFELLKIITFERKLA